MRLNSVYVRNFRGFVEREFALNPEFNLVIGENGSGKTSLIEAIAVAIGSWLLGFRGHDSRTIRESDVRRTTEFPGGQYRILPQYPVVVGATAEFNPEWKGALPTAHRFQIAWERSLTGARGRTTQSGAIELKDLAQQTAENVLGGRRQILPLIRYFGAGRLWEPVRNTIARSGSKKRARDSDDRFIKSVTDPFSGYDLSVDKRCSPDELIRWIANERRIEIDEERNSIPLQLVYRAIESMVPGSRSVDFNLRLQTLVLRSQDGRVNIFSDLSDGYRNVIAIAADLAIKSVMLNPHLDDAALTLTPGVVLIDELDLHLHPRWQRIVIDRLRDTFPSLQFICTTHSPFLIQSLRSADELIVLDGEPTGTLSNLGIEAISAGIMGVTAPGASPRYIEMLVAARRYIAELDTAADSSDDRLEEYKRQLADHIAPFAENPAFQAVLEAERRSRLGD